MYTQLSMSTGTDEPSKFCLGARNVSGGPAQDGGFLPARAVGLHQPVPSRATKYSNSLQVKYPLTLLPPPIPRHGGPGSAGCVGRTTLLKPSGRRSLRPQDGQMKGLPARPLRRKRRAGCRAVRVGSVASVVGATGGASAVPSRWGTGGLGHTRSGINEGRLPGPFRGQQALG